MTERPCSQATERRSGGVDRHQDRDRLATPGRFTLQRHRRLPRRRCSCDTGTQSGPADLKLDLTYTAAGGLHYVYTDHPITCTLTEPFTGGATTIVIEPEVVAMDDPGQFNATVTSVFAVVSQPVFTG